MEDKIRQLKSDKFSEENDYIQQTILELGHDARLKKELTKLRIQMDLNNKKVHNVEQKYKKLQKEMTKMLCTTVHQIDNLDTTTNESISDCDKTLSLRPKELTQFKYFHETLSTFIQMENKDASLQQKEIELFKKARKGKVHYIDYGLWLKNHFSEAKKEVKLSDIVVINGVAVW